MSPEMKTTSTNIIKQEYNYEVKHKSSDKRAELFVLNAIY